MQASFRDVVTVGGAVQHLLADTTPGRTAFVIGTPALRSTWPTRDCVSNGTDLASRAEVVVIAGPRTSSTTTCATRAWPCAGGPTSSRPDGSRPTPGRTACGPAPEPARGDRGGERAKAEIVGKPHPQLLLTALDLLGEGRTLVVGDRVDAVWPLRPTPTWTRRS